MAEELKYTEEQKRCLARTGAISYTIGNYLPSESYWDFSGKDIVEIVTRLSNPFLSDIHRVTLGSFPLTVKDDNTGRKTTKDIPIAYVWLPKNSPNLVDNSLKHSNSSIKFPIPSISKNLQEYGSKFCLGGKLRTTKGVETGSENGRRVSSGPDYVGIIVLVDKFLSIELDQFGNKYAKEFGEEFRRKCDLKIEILDLVESTGSDPDDLTIKRIVVKKSEKRKVEKELRPKKSFSAF